MSISHTTHRKTEGFRKWSVGAFVGVVIKIEHLYFSGCRFGCTPPIANYSTIFKSTTLIPAPPTQAIPQISAT